MSAGDDALLELSGEVMHREMAEKLALAALRTAHQAWLEALKKQAEKGSGDQSRDFLLGKDVTDRAKALAWALADGSFTDLKNAIQEANQLIASKDAAKRKDWPYPLIRAMTQMAQAMLEKKALPTEQELGLTSRCFLATASCGLFSPEVEQLSQFRDTVLRRSMGGRLLIVLYEWVSPPLAARIAQSRLLRAAVCRGMIRPLCCTLGFFSILKPCTSSLVRPR